MVKLFKTELTPTGRPALLPGEVERGMLDKVDMMFHDGRGGVEEHSAEEYRDGYLVLTNYRLIWMTSRASAASSAPGAPQASGGAGAGVPCHLPLPAVSAAEHKSGMALLKAARLKLHVRLDGASYPTPDPRSVAQVAPLKLICRGPSPETMHTQLEAALQRQAWAAAPPGLMQQLHPMRRPAAAGGAAVAGRVGPRPPGERPQQQEAAFQPNWAIVEGLCAISFPRLHAVNAVVATRNAGVQEAVEWLCEHQSSPALDQPSPYLPDSGSGGGGGISSSNMTSAGSSLAQPSSSSAVPLFPAASGGAGGGTTFANPILSGQPGGSGSGWSGLGGHPSGGSGSSWELISGQPSGSGAMEGMYGAGGSGATPAAMHAPMRGAGVSAILQRMQDQATRTDSTMEQAFSDMNALMNKAKEMVQLAEYFRERVAARKDGAAAPGEEGEELDAETALDLLNLGIVSPVTRETAGSLYHQELARQLADFLARPMERAGGMMPLPDIFCLYNRARGTELISPDDLLRAIRLFPQVRAPFTLREFSSGVKVVQSASHSDEAVCKRLAEMVQPRPAPAGTEAASPAPAAAVEPPAGAAADGEMVEEAQLLASLGPAVTRTEVAVSLGMPVAVASEHLRMAEARGLLCRDDGPRGLVYYRNFFSDFADASAGAGASRATAAA